MINEAHFWHARYQQQIGWTSATRRWIFEQLGISKNADFLEIGCGTGAVLDALKKDGYEHLYCLDINLTPLSYIKNQFPATCADGMRLPFQENTFSHALCHFTLMWMEDALDALQEMTRVTRPGGWLQALAEPDYEARLSYPESLDRLGKLQARSLELQGANTRMGRCLISLFLTCGLEDVHAGIIPGQSSAEAHKDAFRGDRDVLARDLAGLVEEEELEGLLSRAEYDIAEGAALWFVPVFYAFGRVPVGQ